MFFVAKVEDIGQKPNPLSLISTVDRFKSKECKKRDISISSNIAREINSTLLGSQLTHSATMFLKSKWVKDEQIPRQNNSSGPNNLGL